jgi:GntR family transcriptional regulator
MNHPANLRHRRAHQALRLRNLLHAAIRSGTWDNGALPSEHDLTSAFDVSRNTVRDALAQLRRERTLDRIPGQGTFTRRPPALHCFDGRHGLRETLGDGIAFEILANEQIAAVPALAAQLGIEPGTELLLIERRNLQRGRTSSLTSSYIVLERVPPGLRGRSADELQELIDQDPDLIAEVTVEALPCAPGLAELLEVPVGSPLLFAMRRTLMRDSGAPIELSFIHGRTDRLAVRFTLATPGAPVRARSA